MKIFKCLLVSSVAISAGVGSAHSAEDVMVIFDASNSMWGQIGGTAKIEIARKVMGNLMGDWVTDTNLGLMAYGHRSEGDCSDIEVIIPPGPAERRQFMSEINGLVPRGKTPLTSAIEQAADTLAYRDNPATVVVISDGIESCERDPCALAESLERGGIGFTAHVVGFGLSEDEDRALACIAEETGGRFLAADDADQLGAALTEVSTAMTEPVSEPEPILDPEPEPAITVTAPETVTRGALFDVSWSETAHSRDYVTIVPVNAAADEVGKYIRAGDDTEGALTAPGEPGLYEVRYIGNEHREIAGTTPIEVVEADVEVTAPETALAGSRFAVDWSRSMNDRDYITIVPMGADERAYTNYVRAGNDRRTLTAPTDPGLFEVRYVLNEDDSTLAPTPIEITEPEVSVSAPETGVAASRIEVDWSAPVDDRDYVTIVPAGADDGEYNDYIRAGSDNRTLATPPEPGLYEVRYVLEEGDRTLASTPIELTAPEASITATEIVRAGTKIDVEWNGDTPDPRDYVTVVPAGAEEGAYTDYVRASNGSPATLTAPDAPGLYTRCVTYSPEAMPRSPKLRSR